LEPSKTRATGIAGGSLCASGAGKGAVVAERKVFVASYRTSLPVDSYTRVKVEVQIVEEGSPIRPETDAEREARHEATRAAYRRLVDPANPPRAPFLLEHHFFAAADADVTGFTDALQQTGFHIETFAYEPDQPDRTWRIVAVKIDLLEERRLLALSDQMDALARQYDVIYDGWLTRVE
jgi:regulator of RNase E activity RraB